MRRQTVRYRLKPAVFGLASLPALWLVWGAFTGGLGTNPAETLIVESGTWTLRMLLIGLALTPLRGLTGWNWPMQLRRMLGLFAFFYAAAHLTLYLWLDQFFWWTEIARDILERPFITVGLLAFTLLLPLALTSPRAAVKRLGAKRWQALHRLVYPAAVAGVVHHWWIVRADYREAMVHAIIMTLLLGYRLVFGWAPRILQRN
ncbi:sulfoxide reductase heme-binding subunit YedZ [Thiohalospira halophila DSM 15071]|uniref:Protein-methionine-sulfoxide reductase heme-binding subunit MsrQ n=1 Tax=Thiohalospira halophila DSM 15071 TaxID=1123397 RepID=A0A1I1UEY2_9GAMM|nr:protein-methionine-sulfoxide reductase heme-binding subunit MsrQ [Thiohalospira halophila]SFD66510.1 sulfoxide reductase heme-binding subunit YedZ [Thiohalospira halophila DSM 15071]